MWKYVGIQRSTSGLAHAIQSFKTMDKAIESHEYINEQILETKNMLQVARLVAGAAKKRKKSLGVHSMIEA